MASFAPLAYDRLRASDFSEPRRGRITSVRPPGPGPARSFIGPLFGILIADYFVIRRQTTIVDDLYTLEPAGAYSYSGGFNPAAIQALIPAALVPAVFVVWPRFQSAANFTWFIGMGLGFVLYLGIAAWARGRAADGATASRRRLRAERA